MSWLDLIDNEIVIEEGQSFAAILGTSPSKGARSPILWNAAFQAIGRSEKMLPLDVSVGRLPDLLSALDADPRFLGGAITMPHKETAASWLGADRLTSEAERIGAVNCLYRAPTGELRGTNTDGEGALESLRETAGDLSGKSVILVGAGGAGKAVAAFLGSAGADVSISSRTPAARQVFAESIGGKVVAYPLSPDNASTADILVNCTPLGFANHSRGRSSVAPNVLDALPSEAVVFDIIYDPPQTPLLQNAVARRLKTLNGDAMNLEQAVLGFAYAIPDTDIVEIRAAMARARSAG